MIFTLWKEKKILEVTKKEILTAQKRQRKKKKKKKILSHKKKKINKKRLSNMPLMNFFYGFFFVEWKKLFEKDLYGSIELNAWLI